MCRRVSMSSHCQSNGSQNKLKQHIGCDAHLTSADGQHHWFVQFPGNSTALKLAIAHVQSETTRTSNAACANSGKCVNCCHANIYVFSANRRAKQLSNEAGHVFSLHPSSPTSRQSTINLYWNKLHHRVGSMSVAHFPFDLPPRTHRFTRISL